MGRKQEICRYNNIKYDNNYYFYGMIVVNKIDFKRGDRKHRYPQQNY